MLKTSSARRFATLFSTFLVLGLVFPPADARDPSSRPVDVIVPGSISVNDVFQVTVKMDRRQMGSTVVTLSTNDPSAVSIPSTITVPNNNLGVSFNATALASATGVTITATANGGGASETFTIN